MGSEWDSEWAANGQRMSEWAADGTARPVGEAQAKRTGRGRKGITAAAVAGHEDRILGTHCNVRELCCPHLAPICAGHRQIGPDEEIGYSRTPWSPDLLQDLVWHM